MDGWNVVLRFNELPQWITICIVLWSGVQYCIPSVRKIDKPAKGKTDEPSRETDLRCHLCSAGMVRAAAVCGTWRQQGAEHAHFLPLQADHTILTHLQCAQVSGLHSPHYPV